MEILSLGRGELRTTVNTAAQIFNDACIAVLSGVGLTLGNEMSISVFMLTCSRNHHNALEIERSFIPSRLHFC